MTITIQEAEKLRADNIQLREALEEVAEAQPDRYSGCDPYGDPQYDRQDAVDADTFDAIQATARAALQGDTPPSPDVPAFDAWYQTRFPAIPKQTREYKMAKAAFAAGQASVKGG